ncbi:MAG: hypothetical protein ACK4Z0_05740 [Sphingomonadaceae bacterium]
MIEVRHETRLICPHELGLDLPARIALPADAAIRGNESGLGYVADRFRREELLEGRLADARSECRP